MTKGKLACIVTALVVGYVGILAATYMYATDVSADSRNAQTTSDSLIEGEYDELLDVESVAGESDVYNVGSDGSSEVELAVESTEQINVPKTGTIMVSSASAISAGLVTAIAVGVLVSIISFVFLIRKL